MNSKRHKVDPVFMASGYNWCRVCSKDIRPWGDWYRHSAGPFDSYRKRY